MVRNNRSNASCNPTAQEWLEQVNAFTPAWAHELARYVQAQGQADLLVEIFTCNACRLRHENRDVCINEDHHYAALFALAEQLTSHTVTGGTVTSPQVLTSLSRILSLVMTDRKARFHTRQKKGRSTYRQEAQNALVDNASRLVRAAFQTVQALETTSAPPPASAGHEADGTRNPLADEAKQLHSKMVRFIKRDGWKNPAVWAEVRRHDPAMLDSLTKRGGAHAVTAFPLLARQGGADSALSRLLGSTTAITTLAEEVPQMELDYMNTMMGLSEQLSVTFYRALRTAKEATLCKYLPHLFSGSTAPSAWNPDSPLVAQSVTRQLSARLAALSDACIEQLLSAYVFNPHVNVDTAQALGNILSQIPAEQLEHHFARVIANVAQRAEWHDEHLGETATYTLHLLQSHVRVDVIRLIDTQPTRDVPSSPHNGGLSAAEAAADCIAAS